MVPPLTNQSTVAAYHTAYQREKKNSATDWLGFPCGSADKKSTCNVGDLGLIPGLGRSPGAGESYPLQYSGLENSTDCTAHGAAKSHTQLSLHWLGHRRSKWQQTLSETEVKKRRTRNLRVCFWPKPEALHPMDRHTDLGSASRSRTCSQEPPSCPGSGRSSEEENGNSLQYSCQENPMDKGAW